MNKIWDKQRTEMLRALHRAGELSFGGIALEINRKTGSRFSRGAIIGKSMRLGLMDARPRRVAGINLNGPVSKAGRPRADGGGRVRAPFTPPAPLYRPPDKPQWFLGVIFADLKPSYLKPSHCRYPHGGEDGTPILFCGRPQMEGSSYCERCHPRCYSGGRTMNLSEAELARRRAAAPGVPN